MPIATNYVPLASNPNVRVDWFPTTAFVNYASPTVTELNSGQNLSKGTAWNNFSFKRAASTTTSDPSLADTADVKDRGIINYGGAMSFYLPGPGTLSTDVYYLIQQLLSQPRTTGYLVVRIDGSKPTTQAYAAGDLVSVYLVETDAQDMNITGEAAFMWTVHFLSQGTAALDTVAKASTNAVVVTPATLSLVHATGKQRLAATVNGRAYTNGVTWTSSAPAVASVSNAGVVTALTAGSATITATWPYDTTATAACTLTST